MSNDARPRAMGGRERGARRNLARAARASPSRSLLLPPRHTHTHLELDQGLLGGRVVFTGDGGLRWRGARAMSAGASIVFFFHSRRAKGGAFHARTLTPLSFVAP